MTRLTRGYLSGNYSTIEQKCDCVESDKLGFYKAINKLGELEDIEDELGIDLIALFKAMKNGIWSKGSFYDDKISDTPTFIARPEISLCGYYEEVNDDCETIKREENVWCIYTYDFELQIRQTMLKDYGKTWALTKEELENE